METLALNMVPVLLWVCSASECKSEYLETEFDFWHQIRIFFLLGTSPSMHHKYVPLWGAKRGLACSSQI